MQFKKKKKIGIRKGLFVTHEQRECFEEERKSSNPLESAGKNFYLKIE